MAGWSCYITNVTLLNYVTLLTIAIYIIKIIIYNQLYSKFSLIN